MILNYKVELEVLYCNNFFHPKSTETISPFRLKYVSAPYSPYIRPICNICFISLKWGVSQRFPLQTPLTLLPVFAPRIAEKRIGRTDSIITRGANTRQLDNPSAESRSVSGREPSRIITDGKSPTINAPPSAESKENIDLLTAVAQECAPDQDTIHQGHKHRVQRHSL